MSRSRQSRTLEADRRSIEWGSGVGRERSDQRFGSFDVDEQRSHGVEVLQIRVGPRVIADFMTCSGDSLADRYGALEMLADHEERSSSTVSVQGVENAWGHFGIRSIVECERDLRTSPGSFRDGWVKRAG